MTLNELKTRLFLAAEERGLSIDNPVPLSLRDDEHNPVTIYVSHEEPHDVTAPFNIIWLIADETSDNFEKVLQRNGRTPNSSFPEYQHAWIELTDYNSVFIPKQVWDIQKPDDWSHTSHEREVGNAHHTNAEEIGALPITGGHLLGDVTSDIDYQSSNNNSLVTKSGVEYRVGLMEQRFGGFTTGLSYCLKLLRRLRDDVLALQREDVTIHQRIDAIEIGNETGVQSHRHFQDNPEVEWNITHTLNTQNLIIQVFDENNKTVLPSEVGSVNASTVKVSFARPERGYARLLLV